MADEERFFALRVWTCDTAHLLRHEAPLPTLAPAKRRKVSTWSFTGTLVGKPLQSKHLLDSTRDASIATAKVRHPPSRRLPPQPFNGNLDRLTRPTRGLLPEPFVVLLVQVRILLMHAGSRELRMQYRLLMAAGLQGGK